MPESSPEPQRHRWARPWPWLVLALVAVPAVWHVLDFPDDIDPEYPQVERPTFSRHPPPAYRLAEPGDTIDRIAIYVSAIGVVVSLSGLSIARDRRGLWIAALSLSLAAIWHASTPAPTFDGWHGLGWRTMFDRHAPLALRVGLAASALALASVVLIPIYAERRSLGSLWNQARERGAGTLLVAAALLIAVRQVEIPGVEPVGYWPRWAQVMAIIAFDLVLVQAMPPLRRPARLRRLGYLAAGSAAWFGLVAGGIALTWYHRPLERLHTVVPGRIYISAMPTSRGLAVAQSRHHFRTIINLFPENTPFRSPRLPEELAFARAHGIRYVGSPSEESTSNAFLDTTLALAEDPMAWPILVHCHGCMDRSPAWMGIYRFVLQGRPLDEILREIEGHRGYRPKASVTLLFNRVLPSRAPERYAKDPTAALLRRCASGSLEAPATNRATRDGTVNPEETPRVSRGGGVHAPRPNLTPSRGSLQYQRTHRDPHLHDPATPS